MHKNTFLLIAFLAVVSALIIGVNIGKRLSSLPIPVNESATNLPAPQATVQPTPPSQFLTYENSYCGITFRYPNSMTYIESASASALFTNAKEPGQSFAVACQQDIPIPALPDENIENRSVASVSAYLYHDSNAKDGTPIDKFIFRHPQTDLGIFLAGYGTVFEQVINSLTILQ